jgi:hypothetical protein
VLGYTPERTREIADQIEESCVGQKGSVREDIYGGGSDETALVGNRVGYRMLAAKMLLASLEEEEGVVRLDHSLGFHYLELRDEEDDDGDDSDTVGSNIILYVVVSFLILFLMFSIVGSVTTVMWLISIIF